MSSDVDNLQLPKKHTMKETPADGESETSHCETPDTTKGLQDIDGSKNMETMWQLRRQMFGRGGRVSQKHDVVTMFDN